MKPMTRILTAVFFCIGFAGVAPAKDASMTLDQLPVPEAFSPRAPLGPTDQAEAQEALVAAVTGKVKQEGYVITDRRIFNCVGYDPATGPQWVVLHAEVGNAMVDTFKAKEFYDHLDAKGPHHLSIWRTSHGDVIAVAQSYETSDGKVLVGYFMLGKE